MHYTKRKRKKIKVKCNKKSIYKENNICNHEWESITYHCAQGPIRTNTPCFYDIMKRSVMVYFCRKCGKVEARYR